MIYPESAENLKEQMCNEVELERFRGASVNDVVQTPLHQFHHQKDVEAELAAIGAKSVAQRHNVGVADEAKDADLAQSAPRQRRRGRGMPDLLYRDLKQN